MTSPQDRSTDGPRSAITPDVAAGDERWRWAMPFVVVGAVAVVAGGLVAAVTGPTDFGRGSWLAAFLVLVAGVAQIALGAGQAWLAPSRPADPVRRAELASWNLGVTATMIGTLVGGPLLTTAGGLVMVVALGIFLCAVRRPGSAPAPRWAKVGYQLGVAILLVSTPVGLVLAWTRAS